MDTAAAAAAQEAGAAAIVTTDHTADHLITIAAGDTNVVMGVNIKHIILL